MYEKVSFVIKDMLNRQVQIKIKETGIILMENSSGVFFGEYVLLFTSGSFVCYYFLFVKFIQPNTIVLLCTAEMSPHL